MQPQQLEAALVEVVDFLESRSIPYMVIGGVAASVWSEPRSTKDIDLTLRVNEDQIAEIAKDLTQHFRSLNDNPVRFAQQSYMLAIAGAQHTRIDLIFGTLPFERSSIDRAKIVEMAGRKVRVCSPEDLILFKIIAFRHIDEQDIRAIIKRQGNRLDLSRIGHRVEQLSEALEMPSLIDRWAALLQTHTSTT